MKKHEQSLYKCGTNGTDEYVVVDWDTGEVFCVDWDLSDDELEGLKAKVGYLTIADSPATPDVADLTGKDWREMYNRVTELVWVT